MKLFKYFLVILSTLIISNCASNDDQLMKKANELAQKFIITDGHIDLPWRLHKGGYEDISVRTPGGDFDYIRSKEGGLDAPFMSIYVPATYQVTGGAKEKALELMSYVERITIDHPEKFEIAKNVSDVERIFSEGKIALPMGMENGAPLEGDLSNVEFFHKKGISYITLTHSEDNDICDSSYNLGERTHNGLSEFGKEVVIEMNRVGIMVDISHVSDEAFYQVMDVTQVPAIASHSSARHFTPGFERNMSDEMIKRLAENGGVIQINFGSSFVTQESQDKRKRNSDVVAQFAKENNLESDDSKVKDYAKQVALDNPVFCDVTDVADHFDHVVNLVGIDHVAFGSDYDGVGDTLPYGLKDASTFPNLIYHLLKRGYSEEDIEKICYKNIWRVWKATEDFAKEA
ncbi:MAG: dipeptidase [Candidatus Neomarinimicrobiota bacterium]|jgi:membrane dipeptidase|tara:strand:- start:975 stop:2180 length:1206 start_codon:yes stop_codon:yes gene_type:complete